MYPKYPCKNEYNMDSHFFTRTNTVRRYYLGAPVLTSKSVHVCDACEKDLTTLRRAIGKPWHKFGPPEGVQIAHTLCVSSILSRDVSNDKEKQRAQEYCVCHPG